MSKFDNIRAIKKRVGRPLCNSFCNGNRAFFRLLIFLYLLILNKLKELLRVRDKKIKLQELNEKKKETKREFGIERRKNAR